MSAIFTEVLFDNKHYLKSMPHSLFYQFVRHFYNLNHYSKHSMLITIRIQNSMSLLSKSYAYLLFRIKFYNFRTIRCDIGNKGYIMSLAHRMLHCYRIFIIHRFNMNDMLLVTRFSLLLRQSNSTAGKRPLSNGCNYISTNGTNIKMNFFHICGLIFIFPEVTCQQFRDGYS